MIDTYYIGGSPCSGKSTIAEALSEKYNLHYFKVDDYLDRYMKLGATNKNEICKKLGEKGVDPGIAGLFQPLINSYKNINDRIVKHNDAVDKRLLEFLLYQTGILIRMVLSVDKA